MKTFVLRRLKDISGVSGTGIVAEGVEFRDGQCVISWLGQLHSIAVYPSIETMITIHGHKGSTVLEFTDGFRYRVPEHDAQGNVIEGEGIHRDAD